MSQDSAAATTGVAPAAWAKQWDEVEDALAALARGEMVLVMDDEDRENEGDLVVAAEFATKKNIAFMCRHTSGLLCAPMTKERAHALELDYMVRDNTDRNQTAFTVSCDALEDTTTGASAGDRAVTARKLASSDSRPGDFSRPGHLFPLIARPGGVLERTGHTEATVDLCILAGCSPVGVIGELMDRQGDMMRLDACREFAGLFGITIINVQQIIAYRKKHFSHAPLLADLIGTVEPFGLTSPSNADASRAKQSSSPSSLEASDEDEAFHAELTAECDLPVRLLSEDGVQGVSRFKLKVFRTQAGPDAEHIVLVKGNVQDKENVLTRVHSVCNTGDVFKSLRCDCGQQLERSLCEIDRQGCGILIYLRDHEGRGIGLTNKIRAYALQQQGLNTYEANSTLGLPHDRRNYAVADHVLAQLGVKSVVLLTNNPVKVTTLTKTQVTGVRTIMPHAVRHNRAYIASKRQHEASLLEDLLKQVAAPSEQETTAQDQAHAVRTVLESLKKQHLSADEGQRPAVKQRQLAERLVSEQQLGVNGGTLSSVLDHCFPSAAALALLSPSSASSSTASTSDMEVSLMRRALQVSLQGRCSAPPNPWVGCVLARGQHIVGEGFHHRSGECHAEVMAIRDAVRRFVAQHPDHPLSGKFVEPDDKDCTVGIDADLVCAAVQGATAYVTLEPCHHQGRTPPCDQALIDAGVTRVCVAVVDPDHRVASEGIAHLRRSGVEVVPGVCADEVGESLAPYLRHRVSKRPYVLLKAAISADGRIACGDGTSKWISGPSSRRKVHMTRAESQAVLVGSGTALADDPQLTPRLDLSLLPETLHARYTEPRARPLLRAVLDSRGRVTSGHLMDTSVNPTLIFTSKDAPPSSVETWSKCGVEHVVVDKTPDGSELDLQQVLDELHRRGILQLMVEGGAEVHGSFLSRDLVDEIHLYIGPKFIGGSGRSWLSRTMASTMSEVADWSLQASEQLEHDVRLTLRKRQPVDPEEDAAAVAQ